MTTPSAERSLHHCSLKSEKNQRAVDKAYHSLEESLLSSQSLSVGHVRTERLVNEFGSLSSSVRDNPCRDSEHEQIKILLQRRQEQIIADGRAEIQKHQFQAACDRSIPNLNGISGNEMRLIMLLQETNNFDEINNFFTNNFWNKIENILMIMTSLIEMEELKRFQGSTFDEFLEKKIDRKSGHYE